jgi:hypothetical protein
MKAMMTSSPMWARASFNISGTPGDNWTGRFSLGDAGAAATALAGAGLEFCARKTGAIRLHTIVTPKAIVSLQETRLFMALEFCLQSNIRPFVRAVNGIQLAYRYPFPTEPSTSRVGRGSASRGLFMGDAPPMP